MSECKVLNALVSTCQECVEDCEDAKYEVLKLLASAKEVGPINVKHDKDRGDIRYLNFWVRR